MLLLMQFLLAIKKMLSLSLQSLLMSNLLV